MPRLTVIILTCLLAVMSIAAAVLWTEGRQCRRDALAAADQLAAAQKESVALRDSVSHLTVGVNSYRGLSSFWREAYRNANDVRTVLLDLADISQLQDKGLSDPAVQLRRDLLAHPELIPYAAVHGSAMGFNGESIALLSTKWAFAKFDDGHIGGSCLLSYDIMPGGEISWKLVASSME